MGFVELLDQRAHVAGELAVDGNGEEQVDLGRPFGHGRDDEGADNRACRGKAEHEPAGKQHREISYLMPEVTKELMKRFWKIRNVMSSGAITISVPAAMVPQACVPSAVAVNTESPTVSGRLSGELITIRGHRKSF